MANRSWTDEQLTAAVRDARSWRGVQRALGLNTTSVTRLLRRRADELEISYVHFTGQRTWSDDALRTAIVESVTWSEASRRLGLSPNSGSTARKLRDRVQRLGLDTSHFGYARSDMQLDAAALPFTRRPAPGSAAGLSVAARWFLDRGYLVSVPLQPAPYDLITESDEGLKRVQVKTTRAREQNGRYSVRLSRSIYDPAATTNAHGKYRVVPYGPDVIDYFFIVANGETMYLIPVEVVGGRMSIVLDVKYSKFKV